MTVWIFCSCLDCIYRMPNAISSYSLNYRLNYKHWVSPRLLQDKFSHSLNMEFFTRKFYIEFQSFFSNPVQAGSGYVTTKTVSTGLCTPSRNVSISTKASLLVCELQTLCQWEGSKANLGCCAGCDTGTAALLSVQVVKHSEITDSKEPCIQIKD